MAYPTAPPVKTSSTGSSAEPQQVEPLEPVATPLGKHKALARSGIFLASCLEEAAFALIFVV